ncbi:hypothetical protein ACE1B6_13125 [Aerosakkonemataceae cyanobacterium BLCC-F154]|uniref:Uncharacterized protein n=1 Tax=Floridaenema fluviatile BLCC-F154 TaxID=3153640 RepID=A0ABV4YBK2_9CYAN
MDGSKEIVDQSQIKAKAIAILICILASIVFLFSGDFLNYF